MNRHIIIGDVHGNHIGVSKLLQNVNYNKSNDILIFVGDYNDYEDIPNFSTKKTIDLLIDIKQKSDNVFFVLGNHDLWFREWMINGGIPNSIWIKTGARQTFKSYDIHNLEKAEYEKNNIPNAHIEFYKNDIQDYYIDDKVVVIHGGFTNPGQMHTISNMEKLNSEQLYQLIWDRRFLFTKLKQEKLLFEKYFGERFLVAGHTPYGPYSNEINPKWYLIDGGSKMGKPQLGLVISDDINYFVSEES